MRAICVDDEPLAVEYTLGQCARLEEIDDVRGFTDGQAALDWLRDHPADLALLDINMPRLDGITLAARIKEMHPQTAILFLTAYKEYAFDAYAVRPAGYLLKPVPLEKLAAEVRYLCGERHPSAPERQTHRLQAGQEQGDFGLSGGQAGGRGLPGGAVRGRVGGSAL